MSRRTQPVVKLEPSVPPALIRAAERLREAVRTEAISRAVRIICVPAVMIHHFLSFCAGETPERKPGAIGTRTLTSKPSGVYLASESDVPRQLYTNLKYTARPTGNDPLA